MDKDKEVKKHRIICKDCGKVMYSLKEAHEHGLWHEEMDKKMI